MKIFVFVVPVFAALFLAAGCVPLRGTLTVSKPVTLAVSEWHVAINVPCARRDDDCEQRTETQRDQQFLPGSYVASLRIDARKSLLLSLHESPKTKTVVDLKLPGNTLIPPHQGSFMLAARDVGQPYDVAGNIDTTHARSKIFSDWESCSYLIKRWRCYGNSCEHIYIPIYGHRPVEYHHEYETKTVVLDLLAVESKEHLARFDGGATRSSKIYDYAGYCH